jgi:hypothetical protein
LEDLGMKGTMRLFILRFSIQGPVPVSAYSLAHGHSVSREGNIGLETTYGWPPVYPHSSLSAFS